MDITFKTTPKLEALRRRGPVVARRRAAARVRGLPVGLRGRPRPLGVLPAVLEEAGRPALARAHVAARVRRRRDVARARRASSRRSSTAAGPAASRASACRSGPTILRLGTDEQKTDVPPRHGRGRDHVGRGLHRAELRIRPRVVAHACGARRRRVGDRRTEDVLHRGSPLQLDHHRGAHRPRLRRSGTRGSATSSPRSTSQGIELRPLITSPTAVRTSCSSTTSACPPTGCSVTSTRAGTQVWFGIGGNPIPTFADDDPGPEEEYEPAPTGHAWVLDELVQYCRSTTRQRRAPRRRPRRPHAARRSRHRRGGREAARVRGRCDVRHPPAPGDHQGVPARVRADVHGDPRPARTGPDRASGRRWRARSTASTAARSATTPAARHR